MTDLLLGIDIGGTNTKFGLVDQTGEVLAMKIMPSNLHNEFDAYFRHLAEELDTMINETGASGKILGAGIGAPNANIQTGTIEYATNLPWKGIVPFQRHVEDHLKIPAVMTNDANAAAIGEMIYGKAKGMKDFFVLTLGTGLGSGFVANGKLIYGADGLAGEFGHVKVKYDERICGCGKRGCLETYVSATGLVRTTLKMMADMNRYPSKLRDFKLGEITSKTIHELAREGDQIAIEAFHKTGRILGQKLADAIHIFSPKAVFLMGGLSHAGDFLIPHVRKYMEEQLMPGFRNKVEIDVTGLDEKIAPVLGAASLAKAFLEDKIM
jgi:glucokinase